MDREIINGILQVHFKSFLPLIWYYLNVNSSYFKKISSFLRVKLSSETTSKITSKQPNLALLSLALLSPSLYFLKIPTKCLLIIDRLVNVNMLASLHNTKTFSEFNGHTAYLLLLLRSFNKFYIFILLVVKVKHIKYEKRYNFFR